MSKKEDNTFYELLGVERNATTAQIRKGYYNQARIWHPDKNPDDPTSEERFKRISQAYQVLSDSNLREVYDKHGEAGLKAKAEGSMQLADVIDALFGGGAFEPLFGSVATLSVVQELVNGSLEEKENETLEAATARRQQQTAEEAKICHELATRLLERMNTATDPAFKNTCIEFANELCDAPGGIELLQMVAYIYIQKAKQHSSQFFARVGASLAETGHKASTILSIGKHMWGARKAAKQLEKEQKEQEEERQKQLQLQQKKRIMDFLQSQRTVGQPFMCIRCRAMMSAPHGMLKGAFITCATCNAQQAFTPLFPALDPWTCGRCTLNNESGTKCNGCGGPRAVSVAPVALPASASPPIAMPPTSANPAAAGPGPIVAQPANAASSGATPVVANAAATATSGLAGSGAVPQTYSSSSAPPPYSSINSQNDGVFAVPPANAAPPAAGADEWACPNCTLLNPSHQAQCAACGGKRQLPMAVPLGVPNAIPVPAAAVPVPQIPIATPIHVPLTPPPMQFKVGDTVLVTGLVSRAELNGHLGVVVEVPDGEAKTRYLVRLGDMEQLSLSVKPENLAPPPEDAAENPQQAALQKKLATEGLTLAWKAGKMFLEDRVRKIVEAVFTLDPATGEAAIKEQKHKRVQALLSIGNYYQEASVLFKEKLAKEGKEEQNLLKGLAQTMASGSAEAEEAALAAQQATVAAAQAASARREAAAEKKANPSPSVSHQPPVATPIVPPAASSASSDVSPQPAVTIHAPADLSPGVDDTD